MSVLCHGCVLNCVNHDAAGSYALPACRYRVNMSSWSYDDMRPIRLEATEKAGFSPRPIFSELFMISPTMLFTSLGTHDRTLFLRWALTDSSRRARLIWTFLTNA